MCSGLQGDETSRYLLKCLLHRFPCRRHFLFEKDFARFIQNAVERPAIAEVQTNREFVSFENHVSIYPNSASLFHSRSHFLCALSTSNIGSVSHPAETGRTHCEATSHMPIRVLIKAWRSCFGSVRSASGCECVSVARARADTRRSSWYFWLLPKQVVSWHPLTLPFCPAR